MWRNKQIEIEIFQFDFISPQISQIHGQYNEKNYVDGEKGHLQN
jgi:hypothetical protein